MATKMKSIKFSGQGKSGEELKFTSEVSVDDDGIFNLTIPEELDEVARVVIEEPCYRTQPRTKLRVSGPALEECKKQINKVVEDYLACEIVEELVIMYGTVNTTFYVKGDETGEIFANGGECKLYGHDERYPGYGSLHATNRSSHFQVGLAAFVRKKISYIRPSGTKVEYNRPGYRNLSYNTYGERLDNVVGLDFPDYPENRLKEMPYSEEAAKFFYDTIIAICALGDRIHNFFGDEASIQKAIEGQGQFLLPSAAKE